MHGVFPGAFFIGPALLFFWLVRLALLVLLIVLVVRLVTHGSHHADHGHGNGYGHGRGYGYGHGGAQSAAEADPRRVAAWRYAAGQIDCAEFDRIINGLDAAAVGAPSPAPGVPAPPVSPPPAA